MNVAIPFELGIARRSDWMTVDQQLIDRFADATLDRQFIHVDPVRAAATPFGGTVAHGFLTLSLLPALFGLVSDEGAGVTINYGFERIRFVHPVRSNSRIRATLTPVSIEEKRPGRHQMRSDVVVEIDGSERPALTAIWLTQHHC